MRKKQDMQILAKTVISRTRENKSDPNGNKNSNIEA